MLEDFKECLRLHLLEVLSLSVSLQSKHTYKTIKYVESLIFVNFCKANIHTYKTIHNFHDFNFSNLLI